MARTETYSITNGNDAKPPLELSPRIESPIWRFIMNSIDLEAGRLFNVWLFRNWVCECLCQAAFVLNVIIFSYGSATSFVQDGKSWGLMEAALTIYTSYFFLMTLILIFKYSHWTFFHKFFIYSTVLGFFAFLMIVNSGGSFSYMAGYDWEGMVSYLYGNGFFWANVYLCVCVTLYTSQIPALIKALFRTSNLHKYQTYSYRSRPLCTCFLPCKKYEKEE